MMTHLSAEIQMANPEYPMGQILNELRNSMKNPKIQSKFQLFFTPTMSGSDIIEDVQTGESNY